MCGDKGENPPVTVHSDETGVDYEGYVFDKDEGVNYAFVENPTNPDDNWFVEYTDTEVNPFDGKVHVDDLTYDG